MTLIQEELALVERQYATPEDTADRRESPGRDFMFLMMDLDGFKEVNDVYGHDAGDRVLLQVCDLIKGACRKSDTVIRWGGDEFVIVGRAVKRDHAEVLAERVRITIEKHSFDLGEGRKASLSGSIGFAFHPFLPAGTAVLKGMQVVSIADRALYVAKTSGRNAWVGISSNDKTPTEDLPRLINDELPGLVSRGAIEVRSSIRDRAKLVLGRQ